MTMTATATATTIIKPTTTSTRGIKLPDSFQGLIRGKLGQISTENSDCPTQEYWVKISENQEIIVLTSDKQSYLYKGYWCEDGYYYKIDKYSSSGWDWQDYYSIENNIFDVMAFTKLPILANNLFTETQLSSLDIKPPYRLITKIFNYDNYNMAILDTGPIETSIDVPNTIEKIVANSQLAKSYISLLPGDFYVSFDITLKHSGTNNDDSYINILRSIPIYQLKLI